MILKVHSPMFSDGLRWMGHNKEFEEKNTTFFKYKASTN